ncbi:MAG: 6-pyruvoyl tetrahydropterin synthase family protein [Thermoplasmatales archaeon]|nr:6-pyruvoyl tetrahydropterin synthase family protein [Thermoplasmatales archaeon]
MLLEIDGGHAGIRFSACHFIPMHDKCSRLHGHSYIMRLRLEGDVGDNGMVMDFVDLKKALRGFVDEYDHMTLLPGKSKEVRITQADDSVEVLTCGKRYVFPKGDVKILPVAVTTAEEMARLFTRMLLERVPFPRNVRSVSVGIDEERGQTAWHTEDLA